MSTGLEGLSGAEATMCAGTYTGFRDETVALYRRIQASLPLFIEEVVFGNRALDVGGRDGRHHSLIKALGPTDVTAIDPRAHDLQRGVRNGILSSSEVFQGTLQKWIAAGNRSVDTAFVFNMLPRLARDPEFLSALSSAVTIGGLAVVSFLETDAHANQDFTHFVQADASLRFRPLVISAIHPASDSFVMPVPPCSSNHYLSVWRREGGGL